MTEPLLEFEERQRLPGVTELRGDGGAGPVAGNVAPRVTDGDAGFTAEPRDQRLIQVLLCQALPAIKEEEVHHLSGLRVDGQRLRRSDVLPGQHGLPDHAVDRLGECRTRLVHWQVKQTDPLLGTLCVSGCRVFLPTSHTADAQATELIRAQAGEEPDDDHRAEHL